MLYQYHCACCDKVVASTDKECPYCGSQHIRSPFGLWVFCVAACFVVVVVIKFVHYIHSTMKRNRLPKLAQYLKYLSKIVPSQINNNK